MKIGQLIYHPPAEKKKNWENKQKNNSVKSSLVFNRTCIKENLVPKYTNIYIN